MKAWEYTHGLTVNAIPVLLTEEEQTWTLADETEKSIDTLLKLKWTSNVPGSFAPESVILGAIQSMESMGYDVEDAEKFIEPGLEALKKNNLGELQAITADLFHALNNCQINKSHPYFNYHIYNTYEEYREKVSFPSKSTIDLNSEKFLDQNLAGWYARIVGGALGTEIEGYTTDQLIKKFGKITTYLRKPNTYNDDITYEIAFLDSCSENDKFPTSTDIAKNWVRLVPAGWSAEQVALDNISHGVFPPESGYFQNPYREWIGAQMRGAICGQVAPGNPELAAYLAFIDGQVSHHNNGIFGEIFNAVLTSLSYDHSDIREMLKIAMNAIPSDCEYFSVVDFAYQACLENDFMGAWKKCEEKYKQYNWIHVYPNAAAEVVALYFGNGDFNETMYKISLCGQDVDCNAAQIGVVVATMNGMKCIDNHWLEPFKSGELNTYLRGRKKIQLNDLIEQTIKVAKKFDNLVLN
ncbi:MAG: ADP-ribosylglycohydrolase family protein [Sphaerochaetaceae bacterium]|nr:ADP-ribosylglycohydrolase family protein [Sphaerochaetaceae bacterium]